MHDLVNVALRTLMCLAFLIWVVRPMLFALSRREPNQLEIEEVVDSAVHSAFRSLGVKNPPPSLPTIGHVAAPEPALEPELTPEPEPTSQDSTAEGDVPAGDVLEAAGVQGCNLQAACLL